MLGSSQPKKLCGPNRDQKRRIRRVCSYLEDHQLFELRKNAKHRVTEINQMAIDAAIERQSFEAVSKIKKKMSADDALLHLKDKAVIDQIEQMLFDLLDTRFLKLLRRRFPRLQNWIAIDFTPEPFYGDKNCPYVTGYEPKDGTYYCFKFMTVSLMMPEGKYLLFSYPAYRGTDRIWLLNRAFRFLEKLGIKPELCLMDREFYAVDVLALCREEKIQYLIPARHDPRFERTIKQSERLPALFRNYEITSTKHESEWTNLVVMESEDTQDKKIFGFITNIHESRYRDDVYILADIYKKRWRIETAHRVHDNFRIRTCCKEGNVRYFFFIVALILYNLWIYINLLLHDPSYEVFRIKVTVYEMKKLIEEFREHQWQIPTAIAM